MRRGEFDSEQPHSGTDPQSPFGREFAKLMKQFSSPLYLQTAKILERISPLDSQTAKILEQFSSPLMDAQLERMIEQYRTPLERSHFGKLLENSFFKTGSVLANLSIEALLKELESRSTELEAPDSDEKRPAEHIEAEGHASISVISAGEARIEKSTTTENDDLSSLPTWLIRVVLYVIFSSIQLIAQWEDIRTSIVDLNARLPQTESSSKIRSFIRKELAGKPGDIRSVTGSNVNFRFEASSKSEIILKLPKNSIVVVQGKEDRTWLLASYEIDGYWIDGYVSTKYLKKVRRN